jgi:long-chain fatty acid transport protein
VLPIPFGGVMRDRVALGLGFYFPTEFITRVRAPFPTTPRLPLLDDRSQVVTLNVALGLHLHRRVDFGVGVLALAALVGQIIVSTDASGNATTLSNQELVTRFSPIVGLRVRATDWLRLGLVYRGESKAEYDVEILTRLGARLPLEIPVLAVKGVAQYDPHQLHLEVAFRVPYATVFVGLGWKHYGDYPLPIENPTHGTPPQPSAGFHDTAVPRVAIEAKKDFRHGLTLVGRAGYAFEHSPADPTTTSVYVDADRHVVGVGAGLSWVRGRVGLHLDAFGQWQHLARATRATGDLGVFGATLGIDP